MAVLREWRAEIRRRLRVEYVRAVGLFAREISLLHVPRIWFPFYSGVSRTRFAYPAFDPVMLTLLLSPVAYSPPVPPGKTIA